MPTSMAKENLSKLKSTKILIGLKGRYHQIDK